MDVAEELVQRVGLVKPLPAVRGEVGDTLVPLVDAVLLVLDALHVPQARLDEAVGLGVEVSDAVVVGADVGLEECVLLAEVLHGGQILAIVLRVKHVLNLRGSRDNTMNDNEWNGK